MVGLLEEMLFFTTRLIQMLIFLVKLINLNQLVAEYVGQGAYASDGAHFQGIQQEIGRAREHAKVVRRLPHHFANMSDFGPLKIKPINKMKL